MPTSTSASSRPTATTGSSAFAGAADPGAPGAASPAWYAGRSPCGERLAAFWTPEWAAVLERRIDAFLARGYDGVFLDDVLHYYTWSMPGVAVPARLAAARRTPRQRGDFAAAMMALVVRLAAYARETAVLHDRDFAVIVNGGAFIGWDAATTGDAAPTAPHPGLRGLSRRHRRHRDRERARRPGAAGHRRRAAARLRRARHPGAGDRLSVAAPRRRRATASAPRSPSGRRTAGFLPYVADDERFARLDPPMLPPATPTAPPEASGTPR